MAYPFRHPKASSVSPDVAGSSKNGSDNLATVAAQVSSSVTVLSQTHQLPMQSEPPDNALGQGVSYFLLASSPRRGLSDQHQFPISTQEGNTGASGEMAGSLSGIAMPLAEHSARDALHAIFQRVHGLSQTPLPATLSSSSFLVSFPPRALEQQSPQNELNPELPALYLTAGEYENAVTSSTRGRLVQASSVESDREAMRYNSDYPRAHLGDYHSTHGSLLQLVAPSTNAGSASRHVELVNMFAGLPASSLDWRGPKVEDNSLQSPGQAAAELSGVSGGTVEQNHALSQLIGGALKMEPNDWMSFESE